MTRAEWRRFLLVGSLLAALLAYVVLSFRVTTDIHHFLPLSEDRELAVLSRQIADSELSRTMILAIEAQDLEAALRASRAFEDALRSDARVTNAIEFLEGGPTEGLERALFDLYEPRRLFFLGVDAREAEERLGDEGLRRAAQRLREELRGPLSSLVSRVAARDPFLTIPSLFERLERSRASNLTIVDGRFVTRDGRTAILFLGTRDSAMDARAQAPLLQGVSEAWARVSADLPETLRLDQSGVNRFATRTAHAIEADIRRVSLVSSVLIGALLLVLFRSLRLIVLASIPVSAGVVTGSAAVLFAFGQLHGITLAFGAALIGVSIDYVVHLYCHQAIVMPEGGARASIRSIRRPLATGAITTLAGFVALSFSSLVGLREVALFSVAGLSAAFLTTLTILPSLMPRDASAVRARERLVTGVERGLEALRTRRRVLALVPLAAIVIVVSGLPSARWNPDLASLARMDPSLVEEDARVRGKVARFEQMRFVVAIGDDEARALEVNDAIAASLREASAAGELGAQRSLAPLLPSPRTQRAVAEVATSDATLPGRLRRIFREEGFSENAFDPFLESLRDSPPSPLTFEALAESPVGGLVRSFRVGLGERVGFVTFLQGVADVESIEARVGAIPGAVFLQQSDLFDQAQLAYQRSTFELLAWGLLGVFVLLALRYREPRRTLVSFVPAVLAAGLTVSVLALSGRGLDLISLTALLFVVSMGVDYSVFLVDAYDEPDSRSVAAALTGALLACVSTVVAFGLLAASDHPVLADLGLTAAVGIATSLMLAPTVLVLARPQRRS